LQLRSLQAPRDHPHLPSFPTRRSSDLTQAGHRVKTATTGAEALRAARDAVPDLVLLDLMLPDASGTEVCRSLKSDAVTRDARVRSEEHTSELQSLRHLVCRLLLEKKNK